MKVKDVMMNELANQDKDKVRNKFIREKVEGAPMEEKKNTMETV